MPRKYHRPPTTAAKRRKGKKTAAPQVFEEGPEPQNGDGAFASEESLPIAESGATPAPAVEHYRDQPTGKVSTVKHMTRDHSYVRAEVLRILVVAGFLIISLVITSILRG